MEYGGYRTVKNVCFRQRGEQVKMQRHSAVDDTIINTDEDGVGRGAESFRPVRFPCWLPVH